MLANRLSSSPPLRPVHDRAAGDVPRADHDVGVAMAAASDRAAGWDRATGRRPSGRSRRPAPRSPCGCRRCTSGPARAGRSDASPRLASRVLAGQCVGHLAGSVRRLIVDDEHADAGCCISRLDEHRQVRPLVVGRDDDERRSLTACPSKRSDEICSETRPIRKITTLSRISSTEEFVTCDCVAIVHDGVPGAEANEARLIGTKMRSGLKIVITFSRIRKKRTPSEPSLIFESPCALAARRSARIATL